MLLFSYILLLISLRTAIGILITTAKPPKNSGETKLELQNVSLEILTEEYVRSFGEDVTFLKISNSEFGEIHGRAFDSLKHLNLLDLSDNEIEQEIRPWTFSRLPGLEILVLRNIGLRRAELSLNNVQELILARNKIEEIGGEELIGNRVNYLDVSSNNLGPLHESLGRLAMLSMVDISRNRISSVDNDVFRTNTKLVRILASENLLTSTEGLRLPWLKTLDLFANKLTTLGSDAFSKMADLEELVLAFNNISNMQDPFKDLLELKYLNLAWNHIGELQADVFRNNLYLSKLSLQGNRLRSLDPFASVHYHLSHLDLSHNELALLHDEFFASTPNLVTLDLSFNRLKTLTDVLAPLTILKTLDVAYNRIALSGYELSLNTGLTRVNLSSNMVEDGLSLFRRNPLLSSLDLSKNQILNFCDSDLALNTLTKLNLRANSISSLSCLTKGKFDSLCEVDLRHNPLTCGEELDDVILDLAMRKGSPYASESHSDVPQSQCEISSVDGSIKAWNSVKRDLCPGGVDLQAESSKEWQSEEEDDGSFEESSEMPKNETDAQQVFVPLGWIPGGNPQSERTSWEEINKNRVLMDELEEDEDASAKETHYSWYIIAPVLIGLSLTLTCFNLAVFLYIRLKVWKKTETASPLKYTFLHNEVYKNTTEPTLAVPRDAEWGLETQTRNKILSYGKINEILLNFGMSKQEKDAESAKNVLIDSSNSQNA